jgi:predicted Zn-dependent peptidase
MLVAIMKQKNLKNGLKIIHYPRKDVSVAINVLVKVGSNLEKNNEKGISHFIEHMVFEGTKTRDALEISRAVEGLGGDLNAYTTNERTCYSIKSLKKHVDKSMEILSDILINPTFEKKKIEKERTIILSEISMRADQPSYHQWDLFMKAVFPNNISGIPVIGYEHTVKKITQQQIIGFHKKYYSPNNMIIAVVGDIDPFPIIEKYFGEMKRQSDSRFPKVIPKKLEKKRTISEKKDINQTYVVIGYPTVPLKNKDGIALEIIRAILGKGMSGRLFDEIRNKRGLGYDVGVHHESSLNYGFFACYVSAEPEKIRECEKIVHQEIKKAHIVSDKELAEAKNFLEGEVIFDNEINHRYVDTISTWDQSGILHELKDAVKEMRKMTQKDLARVAKKYFTDKYARVSIIANKKK